MVNANADSSTTDVSPVASHRELRAAALYFLEGKRRLVRARPTVVIGQQRDFLNMLTAVADKMVEASNRLEAEPKTSRRREVLQFPAGK